MPFRKLDKICKRKQGDRCDFTALDNFPVTALPWKFPWFVCFLIYIIKCHYIGLQRLALFQSRSNAFSSFSLPFSHIFPGFLIFSHIFSGFLMFSHIFSGFLIFSPVFSYFLRFSHIFLGFLTFSQIFAHFLRFSNISSYFFPYFLIVIVDRVNLLSML